MPQVRIKGEVYPFEHSYSLAEAIALEEQLGMTFAAWDEGMAKGSAKAVAGYAWLVLRRNGKEVPLADILSGKYEIGLSDITIEDDGAPPGPGPTPAGGDQPLPGSDTTGGSGSEPSPRPSGTPRRKSTGSRSTSSTA